MKRQRTKQVSFSIFWAADNPAAAQTFQRLRYQEFALERGFESENDEKLEHDEYDNFSYYALAYLDGQLAGGCRLIDAKCSKLPMEKYAWSPICRNSLEVSRYLLNSCLDLSSAEREEIQMALDQEVHDFVLDLGKKYLYVNIRRALLRIKNEHSPFKFEQIGEQNIHPGAGILIPACHRMENARAPAEKKVPLAA